MQYLEGNGLLGAWHGMATACDQLKPTAQTMTLNAFVSPSSNNGQERNSIKTIAFLLPLLHYVCSGRIKHLLNKNNKDRLTRRWFGFLSPYSRSVPGAAFVHVLHVYVTFVTQASVYRCHGLD